MGNIESKRVVLRRLKSSDVSNMQILEADPLVMKFTPRVPQTKEQTMIRLEQWVAEQNQFEPFGIWAAELKADSTFVGWFMLMPRDNNRLELGFMMARDHWKKGLATEVCIELIDFAKSQKNIEAIIAKVNPENTASLRIFEKLAFDTMEDVYVPDKISDAQIRLKTFILKIS